MEKITPSDIRAEAQRLIAAGKMPDLESVLKIVSEVRNKYKPQIEEARKSPGTDFLSGSKKEE